MCHSVNVASTKALTEGVAASAAIMAPCPVVSGDRGVVARAPGSGPRSAPDLDQ